MSQRQVFKFGVKERMRKGSETVFVVVEEGLLGTSCGIFAPGLIFWRPLPSLPMASGTGLPVSMRSGSTYYSSSGFLCGSRTRNTIQLTGSLYSTEAGTYSLSEFLNLGILPDNRGKAWVKVELVSPLLLSLSGLGFPPHFMATVAALSSVLWLLTQQDGRFSVGVLAIPQGSDWCLFFS